MVKSGRFKSGALSLPLIPASPAEMMKDAFISNWAMESIRPRKWTGFATVFPRNNTTINLNDYLGTRRFVDLIDMESSRKAIIIITGGDKITTDGEDEDEGRVIEWLEIDFDVEDFIDSADGGGIDDDVKKTINNYRNAVKRKKGPNLIEK